MDREHASLVPVDLLAQVCGPSGEGYDVEPSVIEECNALAAAPGAGSFKIVTDPQEAVTGERLTAAH